MRTHGIGCTMRQFKRGLLEERCGTIAKNLPSHPWDNVGHRRFMLLCPVHFCTKKTNTSLPRAQKKLPMERALHVMVFSSSEALAASLQWQHTAHTAAASPPH